MTPIQALRMLQDAASYLVAQERTTPVGMAEDIIGDSILAIWNDPNTKRSEYWS